MSRIVLSAILMFLTLGVSQKTLAQDDGQTSFLKKVAYAHGFENWKDVTEIKFTFNVDRGGDHFERSWVWKPKSNDITAMTPENTLKYNWANMDSTAQKINEDFINDKYWLLAPYQLMWDADNIEFEHTAKATAPISKKAMQKLTIVYGSEGGYTPGDAYDLYFGDNLILQEWVYRKGNQAEPSMATTWEDYTDSDGLKIAQMHKNADGSFKLYFTGVEVTTD